MVVATTGSYRNAKKVINLLLDQQGAEVVITKEVVMAAAGSPNSNGVI